MIRSHNETSFIVYNDKFLELRRIETFFSVTIPTSWAQFSDANIRRSQAERAASAKMREEIEACLNKTSNDMWTQVI